MPGYANWQALYRDERRQLTEEGYLVGPEPTFLPQTEAEWQTAYRALWSVREHGFRPGWPYVEPDGLEEIFREAEPAPDLSPLSDAEYADRINGAWAGRCAGCVLGKPLEMGWDQVKIREYLESAGAWPLDDWIPARATVLPLFRLRERGSAYSHPPPPSLASERGGEELEEIVLREDCLPSTRGNVRYAQPDDDIHYTVLSLLLAEEKGPDFTTRDGAEQLLGEVPLRWLWGADYQMYWHVTRLQNEPLTDAEFGDLRYLWNPWREWIDGQLKADFWGYIAPGEPRRAANWAHRLARFSLTQNGIYGAMFVAGCISAALTPTPSVETILQGGLSVIPRRSRLAEAVRNVKAWYAEAGGDWWVASERLYARYGHLQFADQINNLAIVVLALLHGDLDYTRSITTAVALGTDTDCNGATVGSIVGAAIGREALPARWIDPLNDTARTVVAGFGHGRISELAERTIAIHHRTTPRKDKTP